MPEDGEIRFLRPAVEHAFNPGSEDDRGVLQLLVALECFRAADEAYLTVSGCEGHEALGRRCVYFLLKAGYLTEAFKAFMWLDERGWFERHVPSSPTARALLEARLLQLRSFVQEVPAEPCRCCKKLHNDWPKTLRLSPKTLQRLRNKAGFHWDPEAIRKAYTSLIESHEQPATLRFVGRIWRGVASPLAASLLALMIGDGRDPEADRETVQIVLSLGDDLRTLAGLAVAEHLRSTGASLESDKPEGGHADLEA